MDTFERIYERAVERKGAEELQALLPAPRSDEELRATPDHRYLSTMTKCVFQAGFAWRVVENMWEGFEHGFRGFDVDWLARATEADFEALVADSSIVRNGQKIRAVFDNARFVKATAAEHGGFGRFVADWPSEDIVSLFDALKNGGARLGGFTGPWFLRNAGKDTFLLSPDVNAALVEQGIVPKKPTTRAELTAVQAAFNQWAAESRRPLCEMSMILACSVDR